MRGKTDKQFLFSLNLNWLADTRGVLTSPEARESIHIGTPPAFGGEGKPWSPELLFLGSVSGCFMSTYLAFAKKLHFSVTKISCETIGQVEIVEGRYKFTNINLFPRISIADESLRQAATLALEKTHKYCLISNSINASIFYHSEITVEMQNAA